MEVRSTRPGDADTIRRLLEQAWGSVWVARLGEAVDASQLPAFVALRGAEAVGMIAVAPRGHEYEVVAISTTRPGEGVGQALMARAVRDARDRGCERLWLTTTNNNVRAIDFYQQLGLDLCGYHRNGVARSRAVKPEIPLTDVRGVAIAHELEFELRLS